MYLQTNRMARTHVHMGTVPLCTLPIVYFFNDAKIQINLYNCKIFEKRFGNNCF